MATFRKVVFYLLAALYLTGCPLLILYALGYLFQPGAEHQVVKTGLLYVATLPPGASVTVGTIPCADRTPTMIRDLLPDEYVVTVTLDGYRPWSRVATIEAGKSTAFEKVLLLPDTWTPRELTTEAYEALWSIPGSPWLLLRKGPHLEEYLVFDPERLVSWPLVSAETPLHDATVRSIRMVEDNPRLVIALQARDGRHVVWLEPREQEPLVEDLTNLVGDAADQMLWDAEARRYLLTLQHGQLSRVDTETGTAASQSLGTLRGCGLFRNTLYALREDGVVLRREISGGREELLLNDPEIARSLFRGRGLFQIQVLSNTLLVFIGERGELLTNRLPYRFVERGVRGTAFDAPRERLLIWQKGRIGVLDFARAPDDPKIFERGPTLTWVYQHGRDLQQAFWVADGSHILFRDRQDLFLLDVDTLGLPPPQHLFEVRGAGGMVYAERSGTIYYLDRPSGRLCAVALVPRTPLSQKADAP